jgi:hypothetical protein
MDGGEDSLTRKLLVTGALLSCAAAAHAQPRPAVVELFTPEGCSSCPPAEAYVGELAQRPDVLALAFHVDYWDDLGWRDRFGLSRGVAPSASIELRLRLRILPAANRRASPLRRNGHEWSAARLRSARLRSV